MLPKIGVPQNGWFIMEIPIKMDDFAVFLFSETPTGFCSKFFYPKSSLILVSMGLRFFPLSFGGSCPNTRSISKRFIFLRGYLARGTFNGSTLTRNCYCLYHFLLANLFCHVFLQHFPLVCELPFISCNLFVECVTEIFQLY